MFNAQGFTRQTYDEKVADLKAKANQLFGSDIDVSNNSVIGQFIRLMAIALVKKEEEIEQVQMGQFLNYAEGVQLERIGSNFAVTRNPSAYATVTLSFTGQPGYVIDEQSNFANSDGITFSTLDICKLDASGNGSVIAGSTINDPIANVAANQTWVALEPSEAITSISNPNSANGATFEETDFSFRKRIFLALKSQTNSSVNGILSALYGVTGVIGVNLIENKSDVNDANGNTPHSVHAYVRGGADADIAQALLDNVAAGINTLGATQITVADLSGKNKLICFDRATDTPVYMTVTVSADVTFPADGQSQIQQSIADKFGALNMGDTLVYTKLFGPIYSVQGVADANLTIGKSATSQSTSDIQASANEFLDVQAANIKVVVQ